MEVQEGEPGNTVAMDQLFKGKRGVLFAVPGAFTPGCSKVECSFLPVAPYAQSTLQLLTFCLSCLFFLFQTHLPGFVQQAGDLKSKGIEEIACVSVNDAFVMAAWGKEHGADGKVWTMFSYRQPTVTTCTKFKGETGKVSSPVKYK